MLAGVWLIYFSFGLTIGSLAPLVEPMSDALDLSHSAMGGVLGAWALTYVVASIPCGIALDRIGLRRCLTAAAFIMCGSGLLRAVALDHASLFLAVAVFGIGGPLASVGCPKLVGLWFCDRQRGIATGIYMTGPTLGGIIALSATSSVLMPALEENWRYVTLAYASVAAVSGAIWLALSATAFARSVDRGAIHRQPPALLASFTRLLRVRTVRRVLMVGVGLFFFLHTFDGWLPEMLRARGMDRETAGYWASIPIAVGMLSVLFIPRLAVPGRSVRVLVGLCASMVGAVLLQQIDAREPLVAGLVLQGLSRGSAMAVCTLVLLQTKEVGATSIGTASGLFFSLGEVGGAIGPLTVGISVDFTGGFSLALWVLAGVCAVMTSVAWSLRGAPGAQRGETSGKPVPP